MDSDFETAGSIHGSQQAFDKVPETKKYKFKFFGAECTNTGTKLKYEFKAGLDLPYCCKILSKKTGKGKLHLIILI